MSIRRMRISDVKEVYLAECSCFSFGAWPQWAFTEALYDSHYNYVAVAPDGDIMGYVLTDQNDSDRVDRLIAPDDDIPIVTIASIAIKVKYRRQGWAQALIRQLLNDLASTPNHFSLMVRHS